MERYTHRGKAYISQLLHSICMFLLSIFFLYSFIFNLINAKTIKEYLLSLMVLCFAISIWYSFYISIRSLSTIVFINEKGMGIKRFNSIKLFIKYEDIKEINFGKAKTFTGEKRKLYFAKRSLTLEERSNLDLLQNEIIYFTNLNSSWKKYIEEHSNLKI